MLAVDTLAELQCPRLEDESRAISSFPMCTQDLLVYARGLVLDIVVVPTAAAPLIALSITYKRVVPRLLEVPVGDVGPCRRESTVPSVGIVRPSVSPGRTRKNAKQQRDDTRRRYKDSLDEIAHLLGSDLKASNLKAINISPKLVQVAVAPQPELTEGP